MADYEKLYKALFNGLTDAIKALEEQEYLKARIILIHAQQEAEEIFMDDGEDGEDQSK